MRRAGLVALLGAVAGLLIAAPANAQRKTPYWASISAGKARMRTGPGRNYPASWLYQRAELPVKVIGVYKEWRKIEDPGGTQGWMQANLLSDRRTGFIIDEVVELREQPAAGSRLLWRAAPGVVGRLSKCAKGWCWLDIRGRGGFVERAHLFGIEADEDLP